MASFIVIRAESPTELRAHLRKRWLIFGREESYLPEASSPSSMEFDCFDSCSTTVHFNILIEENDHAEDHRRR